VGQRIAIVCPGRAGDVAESTGFIPYIAELWGEGAEVHWFVQEAFAQVLEHLPLTVRPIGQENGHDAAKQASETIKAESFDAAYYTAPWLNWDYIFKIPLPMIPRYVLDGGSGKLKGKPWWPRVVVTDAEKAEVAEFAAILPEGKRIILETGCFSHQGEWTDDLSKALVERLKAYDPVYLTASANYKETMRGFGAKAVGLDALNFRQLVEVWNASELYIGVPSGTASVTCAGKRGPRIEFLTPDRCPAKPGLAPDWGTASISGAYSYSSPAALLDRSADLLGQMHASSPRERRRFKRRLRRKGRGAKLPAFR
jgi:ADP-heptose:LPS heptosyltransferase